MASEFPRPMGDEVVERAESVAQWLLVARPEYLNSAPDAAAIRTILARLAQAERRAEEAERVAAERLEALQPFALLAAQPDGTAGVNMNSSIGRWLSVAQLDRAAALTTAAQTKAPAA